MLAGDNKYCGCKEIRSVYLNIVCLKLVANRTTKTCGGVKRVVRFWVGIIKSIHSALELSEELEEEGYTVNSLS